jgi:hypothetical protein
MKTSNTRSVVQWIRTSSGVSLSFARYARSKKTRHHLRPQALAFGNGPKYPGRPGRHSWGGRELWAPRLPTVAVLAVGFAPVGRSAKTHRRRRPQALAFGNGPQYPGRPGRHSWRGRELWAPRLPTVTVLGVGFAPVGRSALIYLGQAPGLPASSPRSGVQRVRRWAPSMAPSS